MREASEVPPGIWGWFQRLLPKLARAFWRVWMRYGHQEHKSLWQRVGVLEYEVGVLSAAVAQKKITLVRDQLFRVAAVALDIALDMELEHYEGVQKHPDES